MDSVGCIGQMPNLNSLNPKESYRSYRWNIAEALKISKGQALTDSGGKIVSAM